MNLAKPPMTNSLRHSRREEDYQLNRPSNQRVAQNSSAHSVTNSPAHSVTNSPAHSVTNSPFQRDSWGMEDFQAGSKQ